MLPSLILSKELHMSQEAKKSSVLSSSSSTTTSPQDNKSIAVSLPQPLPLGDAKVAALLKPVKANITIKQRYRDTAFADEIFAEPYSCDTGDVYEWEQITHWLKTHDTSPKTNEKLESKKLRPARDKQEDVQEFLDENPELRDSEELYLPRHWVKELEQACQEGDTATIKRLCERDKRLLRWTFNFDKAEGLVDPADYERWYGKNILHLACQSGTHDALVQLVTLIEKQTPGLALHLLLQADSQGHLPLHHAIKSTRDVHTLLSLKAWMGNQLQEVSLPSNWHSNKEASATTPLDEALMHCALEQDLAGIRFFLRLGANRSARNSQGETAIYLASKAGRVGSLKILLAPNKAGSVNNVDLNQLDPRLDDTPLHAAVRAGHLEIIPLLKKQGAKVDTALKDGSTPFHLAVITGNPQLITALCDDNGTLPPTLREKSDAKGQTLLHRAILAGSLETVKWLLAQKASITAQNHAGQNALHLAAMADHVEMLQLLLQQGMPLNTQDQAGNTAFHLAATAGSQTTLAALLRAGSSPTIKNKAGQTARECAPDPATAACYDLVTTQLREKEAETLKAHGPLGVLLLQQQELIRQQQVEIDLLRERVAKLEAKLTLGAPASSPQKPVASSSGFGLFDEKKQAPAVQAVVDEKALGQLLKFVAEGEQDQAEALIRKDSTLLLAAGKVTDLSGRTFENITAFQYALWAMDYHMWTMIQKYLPTEAQAKQHALLESKGTAHGKHFDLQPLLGALKTYIDNAYTWRYSQRAADQWCKKVGGAQKLLPAHVVNEYCRPDRPFDPCPTEWTAPLPRTRSVSRSVSFFGGGSEHVDGDSWFSAPQLGVSFAFYRYQWPHATGERDYLPDWGWSTSPRVGWVHDDLKSLQALWNARTKQLKLLADTLVVESQSAMQVGLK
jgi:ankyrin repeat protein